MSRTAASCLILSLAHSAALPARAWGPAGHKAVALIAQKRLSSGARAKLSSILGEGVGLDAISVCADAIRDSEVVCGGVFLVQASPDTSPWHYIDIPISDSPSAQELERYCIRRGLPGQCVVDQIRAHLRILGDAASSRGEKRLALMYLVHLTGDLHQPLHCATEMTPDGHGDRGGNLKEIRVSRPAPGKTPNLHTLWDMILFAQAEDRPPSAKSLARALERSLRGKDVSAWTGGDPIAAAALESFIFAKERIYPAYADSVVVDAAYEARMRPLAYERLEKAGVRLAFLLERALRR